MVNNFLDDEDQPSTSSLLSDILKKYNLEDSTEKIYEKLEKDEQLNLEIISNAAYDLAENKILDKDLSDSLKKNLNIDNATSKLIQDEIKSTVVPPLKIILAKKMSRKPAEEEEIKTEMPILIKGGLKLPKKIEKSLPEKIKSMQKKGPDSYREPIE